MALSYFLQTVIYWILSYWILLFLYSSLPSPPKGVSLVRKHFKILPKVLQRIEALFIAKTLLQDGYHKVGHCGHCQINCSRSIFSDVS
jgi:hypothetical protein